jgi:hypothetical protein
MTLEEANAVLGPHVVRDAGHGLRHVSWPSIAPRGVMVFGTVDAGFFPSYLHDPCSDLAVWEKPVCLRADQLEALATFMREWRP